MWVCRNNKDGVDQEWIIIIRSSGFWQGFGVSTYLSLSKNISKYPTVFREHVQLVRTYTVDFVSYTWAESK